MPEHEQATVVVIGAGLAGLTAAATAARAGSSVLVLDAHGPGGRARTDERGGFRFNQGPHALVHGGESRRILGELGVEYHGHRPAGDGARLVRDGTPIRLPARAMAALAAKLLAAAPARWTGRSAAEWVASLGGPRDVPDLARMLIRITTYVTDLQAMPADFAISRLKNSWHGVTYLDGGFGTLVAGLASVAVTAGATVRDHRSATALHAVPGGWDVVLAGGEVVSAVAVVIAAGGPTVARELLPVDPAWPELGPPVTAACLDLGLRGPSPSVLFGLDQPLYLARHAPPGDLAPAGGSVVHVMRYGARDPQLDRAELRRHARLAGITDDMIVEERFLAEMVVTHLLPDPRQGLAGRPGVEVTGVPGVFLAGDWVGPTGWLSEAAMSSGERAGRLAARVAAANHRPYPRVA